MSGLGLKPSDLAAAQTFNQLVKARKTPRPTGLLGQPVPSSSEAGSDRELRTLTPEHSTFSPRGGGTTGRTVSNKSLPASKSSVSPNRPHSLHSRSVNLDRQVRIESGCQRLAEAFHDQSIVRNSKTLIDAFDLIKETAEKVAKSMEKVDETRERLVKKAGFNNLWRFLYYIRKKRQNKVVLEQALIRRMH